MTTDQAIAHITDILNHCVKSGLFAGMDDVATAREALGRIKKDRDLLIERERECVNWEMQNEGLKAWAKENK